MSGMDTATYQTLDVHAGLAGEDADSFSFGHYFTVTDINGQLFLSDHTFGQFVNPETGAIHGDATPTGQNAADHPIIQDLYTKGFFKLTDETLREYLRITGDPSQAFFNPAYADQATVAAFNTQTPYRRTVDTKPFRTGTAYHVTESCNTMGCERILPAGATPRWRAVMRTAVTLGNA
jgi:hypothetical protein